MILPVRTGDDPILAAPCDRVEHAEMLVIAENLRDTLHQYPNALGLAAPQIGFKRQVIYVKPNRNLPGLVMGNPKIVDAGDGRVNWHESCLSYPDVFLPVERPSFVRVEYNDLHTFKLKTASFTQIDASIVQHEIQHLEGKCYNRQAWWYIEGRVDAEGNPKT